MSATRLKVLADRIACEKIEDPDKKSSGGIILPGGESGTGIRAKVVSLGQGYRQEDGSFTPLSVEVGDTVMLREYAGSEVKLDGKSFLVVKESDIIVVLN
jgi:chaperonin GroES